MRRDRALVITKPTDCSPWASEERANSFERANYFTQARVRFTYARLKNDEAPFARH
jgi:hypothetical protein